MRFEELSYREDGLPVAVPIHPRLTMVGRLGVRGRSGWIGRALGVLLGTRSGDGTSLTLCDQAGCHLRLDRDGHGAARLTDVDTGEDLTPAAADLPLDGRYDWFASLGLDSRSADGLVRVTPSDFKGADVDPWAVEDQLVEARVALARLEAEYEMVVGRCRHAGELYRRVEELDEWLGRMEEERARRRYGEALQTVRRLEADVAILRQTAASEQQTAEAILAAAVAGQEWQRATEALEVARLACREHGLPETECPSTPAPALPGVASTGSGTGRGTVADELEVAHRALEEAERELDRARLPGAALIARRRLARADRREQAVLEQMGCTS
ncbi:MAG: hypothetical protein ACRD0C_15520, partial [Acidimicrobiia bacterium]